LRTLGTYCGATLLDNKDFTEHETNKKIELEYYEIENSDYNNSAQEKVYGISIVKKEYKGNEINFENNTVEKISTNRSKVTNLINILMNYKVTPIALEDVLDDLLKQKQCEIA